jgi:hypothetical protein
MSLIPDRVKQYTSTVSCFFSTKHSTLMYKSKDWLGRNQDAIKSPFLGMNGLIIKYVLKRYYFCSSSRTTRHCIIFKIAFKYLKTNLRRPFANCEITVLLYRITDMSTLQCINSIEIQSSMLV